MKFVVDSAREAVQAFGQARAAARRRGRCEICGRGSLVVVAVERQVAGAAVWIDMCRACRREGY
jgi:ribosomal protein S14